MVQAPDAASELGTATDLEGIEDLAKGSYRRGVREGMPRDYVTMYHPDGTTSIVQIPQAGKHGRGIKDRQQKIMHYMLNKKRDGKQWWYASPPAGWKPAEIPWRCPVEGCTRRGGMKDLLNLWLHIKGMHQMEVELYRGVLTAIETRLAEAKALNLDLLYEGGGDAQPLADDADLAVFRSAQDALDELPKEPAVAPETFEGGAYDCRDCNWKPKEGAKSPAAALMMHRSHVHPKGDE